MSRYRVPVKQSRACVAWAWEPGPSWRIQPGLAFKKVTSEVAL